MGLAFVKIISTFFFVGYIPLFPGTAASLAAIFLYYFLKDNAVIYTVFTFILLVGGFIITQEAEKIYHKKDARCIVLDEVAGLLLSLILIPYNVKLVIIAFFLFRVLDTIKPYPADRLQAMDGGLGIMGDDIIAGLYTNIILQAFLKLNSFMVS